MNLGYILFYVPDVQKTMEFYEKAFGMKSAFIVESGLYGEMLTGDTKLGFVDEKFVEEGGLSFVKNRPTNQLSGSQISLVTQDVDGMYQHALQNGAQALKAPVYKPWGQRVSFVRDLNGCMVEICSQVN